MNQIPEDLRIALAANPAARETFGRLAPSHVREYVQWIDEARLETTRRRRIERAIEMLAGTDRDD